MKINSKIKLAMARYYQNRGRQYKLLRIEGSSDKLRVLDASFKWDKSADLDAISEAVQSAGYTGMEASAGTFWLERKGRQVVVNESNYLDGGEVQRKTKTKAK